MPGPDLDARRCSSRSGAADARQQRGRGGDDQTRRAGRGGVQRASARRRHAEMRRHAAIRIDLQRRQRKNGPFDVGGRRAFERRIEEAGVRGHLLDVLVRRHDEQRDAGGGASRDSGRKRLCRRRQTGKHAGGSVE